MSDVVLRVQSVTVREKDGITRVVLVMDYLGVTPVDFEDQIQEGEDVTIELPSTSPPG